MQAMVLAAGRGTRMQPITHNIPKPLFPVLNVPCIERILRQLESAGFKKVIINLCHLSDSLSIFLKALDLSIELQTVIEPFLLGTGGGIKNASHLFDPVNPILVINSDVVTDLDLSRLWEVHRKGEYSLATLFVHDREPFNTLKVKGQMLLGFDYHGMDALAFTGISVLEPGFFEFFPSYFPSSLIDAFKAALFAKRPIRAYRIDAANSSEYIWQDIGTPSGYINAHEDLLSMEDKKIFLAKGAYVSEGAMVRDWVCIGEDVFVPEDVNLGRTVIWDKTHIDKGMDLTETIVTPYGLLRA